MSALKVKGILLLCHLVAKLYGAKEFCGTVYYCNVSFKGMYVIWSQNCMELKSFVEWFVVAMPL
jgi:hypothetical protein